VLLTLYKEGDLGPFELSISVAKRTGAVLFGFGRLDASGIADGTRVLECLSASVRPPPFLDVLSDRMDVATRGYQQPDDRVHRGDDFAILIRRQHAD